MDEYIWFTMSTPRPLCVLVSLVISVVSVLAVTNIDAGFTEIRESANIGGFYAKVHR